ncbi:MAG: 4'-phosphopantetheinyl transferase superfamily protein [Coriobacteriaceae bacterium]|nr:4'-phosphopantetheinyl transferase superfamily protein [Coriobacteriaceae bacterium]
MNGPLRLELQPIGLAPSTAAPGALPDARQPGLVLAYLELGVAETQHGEAARLGNALEPHARPPRVRAAKRLRQPIDRLASLAAGVLVDVMAAPLFRGGRAPIDVAPNGKPDFKAGTGAHFNLSHSRSAVCCAIGAQPVGIDVEPIVRDYEDIRDLCLTECESGYVEARASRSERARAFTRIWTRKEALGKWLGCGLENAVLHADMLRWPCGYEKALLGQCPGIFASPAPSVSTFDARNACVSVCGNGPARIVTMTLTELLSAASALPAASWKGDWT